MEQLFVLDNRIVGEIIKDLPDYITSLNIQNLRNEIYAKYKQNALNAEMVKCMLDKYFEELRKKMTIAVDSQEFKMKKFYYEIENRNIAKFFSNYKIKFYYDIDLDSKVIKKMELSFWDSYIGPVEIENLKGAGLDLNSIELQMMFGGERNLLHPSFGLKKLIQEWALNNFELDFNEIDKNFENAINRIQEKIALVLEK